MKMSEERRFSSSIPPSPPSLASRASSMVMKLDIAYLFSCPLIYRSASHESVPLKLLDIAGEIQQLKETFKEAGKDIRVRFECATSDNFRMLMTAGCKAIHYSGHGLQDCLAFEDLNGAMHMLSNEKLQTLVSAGGVVNLKFVFISACYSEVAGMAFANAGVPHVVAVQWDSPISDKASQTFSKHFYHSLLVGKTVRESFEIGKSAVYSHASSITEEHKKFLLLPEEGDHDVPIFPDLDPGRWLNWTPDMPFSNMPSSPEKFLGRNKDVYDILKRLSDRNRQLIILHGEKGIGKSSLAKFVGNYAHERRRFNSIWIPVSKLIYTFADPKKIQFKDLIWEELKEYFPMKKCNSNKEFVSEFRRVLGDFPTLLFLDGVENAIEKGSFNHENLSQLLETLLEKASQLVITLTLQKPFAFTCTDVKNQFLEIQPLCLMDSALLFESFSRVLATDELGSVPGNKTEKLSKHPTLAALRGNPALIFAAANYLNVGRNLNLHSLLEKVPEIDAEVKGPDVEEKKSDTKFTKSADTDLKSLLDELPSDARYFWTSNFGENKHSCKTVEFYGAISRRFNKATSSKPLSESDLKFFLNMLVRKFGNESNESITIPSFSKFWNWFTEFVAVISEVPELWAAFNPKIMYLCSSNEANEILRKGNDGAFLLRFSESFPGFVSLAYINQGELQQNLVFYSNGSWRFQNSKQDYKSLGEVLLNFKLLKTLPNGISKEEFLKNLYPHLRKSVSPSREDGPD